MSALFNPTVAWITLRATLSRKRALLFALPAAILILLTVALKASRPPMRPWPTAGSWPALSTPHSTS